MSQEKLDRLQSYLENDGWNPEAIQFVLSQLATVYLSDNQVEQVRQMDFMERLQEYSNSVNNLVAIKDQLAGQLGWHAALSMGMVEMLQTMVVDTEFIKIASQLKDVPNAD